MSIRWENISDWDNSQDSSGTNHGNDPYTSSNPETLKQGYTKQWPPMTHGLVGWWPLHTNNPVDLSGNGNHGTSNGGVTTGIAGKAGLQAMSFDGSDDWTDFGFSTFYSQGTLCFWVKAENFNSDPLIGNGGTGEQSRTTVSTSPPHTIMYQRQANGNSVSVTSTTELSTTDWRFVVARWDESNDTIDIWVDATKEDSDSYTYATPSSGDGWRIARQTRDASSDDFFAGEFCDARLYNRALSAAEIQTLYEWGSKNTASPPTDGVARYALDGDATDTWGNNDGTENGNLVYSSDAIRGKSGDFDGTDDYIDLPHISQLSAYSMCFWSYANTVSDGNYHQQLTISENNTFQTRNEGDSTQYFYHKDGNGNWLNITAPTSANVWEFWTCVWDGSTMKLYKNGTERASRSASGVGTSNASDHIGQANGANYFDGLIDDVRIYDRALTPEEVQELYRWGTKGVNMNKYTVMQ